MDFSGCAEDVDFGPSVRDCRGGFDFTIKFENIIFSMLPSAIFIAVAAARLFVLLRKTRVVDGGWFQLTKVAAIAILAILQVVLLAFATKASIISDLFVGSVTLDLIASLSMVAISFWEHSRSPRPSFLLNSYLPISILFDIVRTRTLWLAAGNNDADVFARIYTAATVWKTVITVAEAIQKEKWLKNKERVHGPEEIINFYKLSIYVWLFDLLVSGSKKIISIRDLLPLDHSMDAEQLQKRMETFDASKFKGKKHALTWDLIKRLGLIFWLPMLPKIINIVFLVCQPLLIQSLLQYLSHGGPASFGYGLIGATIILYVGAPLTMAIGGYYTGRLTFQTRGILVNAIYRKTTLVKSAAADDAKALTLMSTDVERIRIGVRQFHTIWIIPFQVGAVCYLLYRQLGAAFAAPICVILVCVLVSAVTVRFVNPRQREWMEQIQKRTGKTANAIGNVKNIKISGMAGALEEAIQKLRVVEVALANKYRWMDLLATATGFTPGLFSALFTFAVTSETLNVSSIFTSVALLGLVADPLNGFFQGIPSFLAVFTCMQRIQDYLEQDNRVDFRIIGDETETANQDEKKENSGQKIRNNSIRIVNGTFGWEKDRDILKNINTDITDGLNIVVGPVGSGKSTLCNVLLGETPFHKGEVVLKVNSTQVGYCGQVPFLLNATIKENIVGFGAVDEARYARVLEATMLNPDLLLLAKGDQSNVGSNGITLSGGQRQRVAIARAIYQRCKLFVFDDILSGLDKDTEQHVFSRVFGPKGLLRQQNATVLLCTHSVRHLPWADHIIALGADGTVVEDGTFQQLLSNKKYVYSLGVEDKIVDTDSNMSTPPGEMEEEVQVLTPPAPANIDRDESDPKLIDLSRTMGDKQVFWHYFKNSGLRWVFLGMISGLFCGILWSVPNLWLKTWVEDISTPSPNHTSAFYIGIYAVLQFLAFAFLVIECGVIQLVVASFSGIRLHHAALRTVLKAPLRFFTTTDVGLVTNYFSQDMSLLDAELPEYLINVVAMFWLALVGAAVVAVASPYVLIVYPFIGLASYFIIVFYLKTSRQLRLLDLEAKSPLYTNFLDTIKGITTYRAFTWTDESVIRNNLLLNTSTRPAYQLLLIQNWIVLMTNTMTAIIAIVVVALSTQLKSNSGLVGASMVSIIIFGGFLGAFINNYTGLETSIGAVARLKTFTEHTAVEDLPGEDTIPPVSWPEKGKIEIRNVSASYDDPKELAEAVESEKNRSTVTMALRDLDLTIKPGEKVAICGRTGSGKSSFILVLLRLLDTVPWNNGFTLSIDGLSLSQVDRASLRQRLIAVPQDPVFLPEGTSVRLNIDPGSVGINEECQASLQAVNLWDYLNERGGLDHGLSPDTLSQGQKQLFSLARAILRRRVRARELEKDVGQNYLQDMPKSSSSNEATSSKEKKTSGDGGILILDEYSSSLDIDTDKTMQEIIHKEFAGYTIVMVSHRLEMVMNFDRVIILDAGKVAEQGSPKVLVEQQSRFKELWMIGRSE